MAASSINCSITTPEELVFEGDVSSVVLPAVDGQMGVLPRHAPLIGSLGYGELRVRSPGTTGGVSVRRFFVDGGFVQVLDNRVSVLAVNAEPVEKLDAKAEEETVRKLQESRPASGASMEEVETHRRSLEVARTRMRLAAHTA